MQDLRQIVVDEWNAMPQQRCSAVHIQYEAVVVAFGGSTQC